MNSPIKLFYVDDEPDIREIAVFALELDPAIEVRTAPSGVAALAQLDEDAWRPDVFLLDVMMPELDGPATLARIRDRADLKRTPAIFITARAQPHEMQAFLDKGASGVITKPFDPMTLAQQVRGIIASTAP